MTYYPAVITYVPDDEEYIVEFVDFPEGLTCAKTLCKALVFAEECLWGCIDFRIEDGLSIPAPSEFVPNLTQLPDRVSWWTMVAVPYTDMADDENFERIMSGLQEVADMVKDRPVIGLEMSPSNAAMSGLMSGSDRPVSVIGLETGPSNTDAETALGLIPGKW